MKLIDAYAAEAQNAGSSFVETRTPCVCDRRPASRAVSGRATRPGGVARLGTLRSFYAGKRADAATRRLFLAPPRRGAGRGVLELVAARAHHRRCRRAPASRRGRSSECVARPGSDSSARLTDSLWFAEHQGAAVSRRRGFSLVSAPYGILSRDPEADLAPARLRHGVLAAAASSASTLARPSALVEYDARDRGARAESRQGHPDRIGRQDAPGA